MPAGAEKMRGNFFFFQFSDCFSFPTVVPPTWGRREQQGPRLAQRRDGRLLSLSSLQRERGQASGGLLQRPCSSCESENANCPGEARFRASMEASSAKSSWAGSSGGGRSPKFTWDPLSGSSRTKSTARQRATLPLPGPSADGKDQLVQPTRCLVSICRAGGNKLPLCLLLLHQPPDKDVQRHCQGGKRRQIAHQLR